MIEIHPITDDVPEQYSKALDKSKTKEEMIIAIENFGDLAEDALEFVKNNDFKKIKTAIRKERSGKFAGPKYAPLILPREMFEISIMADQYKVPFGLAYIRKKEMGDSA